MSDASILEKAVADLLTKAISAAEAAGKFAVDQLPDTAQQYVLYVGIISSVWTFFGFLMMSCPYFLFHLFKKWNDERINEAVIIPTAFATVILGGTGLMILSHSFERMIMAFFAPKILLIQFASDLVI